MAYKCSAIKIDGEWKDVYKDPITDKGKRSKKGRLDLMKNEAGEFVTVDIDKLAEKRNGGFVAVYGTHMVTYFENGEILVDDVFEAIRERIALTNKEKYATIGTQ